jgi:hypothetical protein
MNRAKRSSVTELIKMAVAPTEQKAYAKWLEADDALHFLESELDQDDLVIYANFQNTFINTVLVPNTALAKNSDKLNNWDFSAYQGWGVLVSFSPKRMKIVHPLHGEGPIYSQAEQLVFAQSFSGRQGGKHYHEILQKFTQVVDIHYIDSRNAYCRIDQNGDLQDVIKFIELGDEIVERGGTIITCKRELLDEFLAAGKTSAIRMFDFTRLIINRFGGWQSASTTEHVKNDLRYYQALDPGHAGYVRGAQIVKIKSSRQKATQKFEPGGKRNKSYVTFKVLDWGSRSSQRSFFCSGRILKLLQHERKARTTT